MVLGCASQSNTCTFPIIHQKSISGAEPQILCLSEIISKEQLFLPVRAAPKGEHSRVPSLSLANFSRGWECLITILCLFILCWFPPVLVPALFISLNCLSQPCGAQMDGGLGTLSL